MLGNPISFGFAVILHFVSGGVAFAKQVCGTMSGATGGEGWCVLLEPELVHVAAVGHFERGSAFWSTKWRGALQALPFQ